MGLSDLRRQEQDAEGNHRLDRRSGHIDEAQSCQRKRDAVGHRESGDRFEQQPEALDQQE